MLLDAFLPAARFAHHVALTTLFGVALFPPYARRRNEPTAILIAAAAAGATAPSVSLAG